MQEPLRERRLERDAVGIRFQAVFERGQGLVPGRGGVGELAGGGEEIAGGGLALRQIGAELVIGRRFLDQPLTDGERLIESQPRFVELAGFEQRLGQILSGLGQIAANEPVRRQRSGQEFERPDDLLPCRQFFGGAGGCLPGRDVGGGKFFHAGQ